MPDFPNPISRRPVGKAIVRTAEQRAKLAAITRADILAGRMLWMEMSPRGFEALLEARVEEERAES